VSQGFALHLASRYLRSARRDAFTSFLSAVAGGGIGLGVAALVLALSALAGMQRTLRTEILARTPSLALTLPADFDALALERELLSAPEVTSLQRTVEGRGWILGRGTAVPVRLLGYQGAPPRILPGLEGGAPGLYLPDRLAARLGVATGEIVDLASPRPALTPLGPRPRVLSMRVEGVYRTGLADDLPTAALPLERAEILLGRSRDRRLLVTTSALGDAAPLAQRIQSRLPAGARLETWKEINRPLFFALSLERTVLFVAVSLIVAVAAVALYSDLQLLAATKRRELAVLAAMGAGEAQVRRAFVLLGLMLGGGGAVLGGCLGGVLAWALDRWRLVRLPSGLLIFDALPFDVRAGDVVAVVGVTVLVTWMCAVWGATRAAKVSPAEALRG